MMGYQKFLVCYMAAVGLQELWRGRVLSYLAMEAVMVWMAFCVLGIWRALRK